MALAPTALRKVPIRTIELGAVLLPISFATTTSMVEALAVLALLEYLVEQSHAGLPRFAALHGISTDTFAQLCDALAGASAVSSAR